MDKNKSREYLKSLTINQRKKLADLVGVSQEYLFMIGNGGRTPSRKTAALLELKTDCKVKAVDFSNEVKQAISA